MSKTITTYVNASNSPDPTDQNRAMAVNRIARFSEMLCKYLELGPADAISVMAAAATVVAEDHGARRELADVFEQWVVLLRDDANPLSIPGVNAGNA